MNPLYTYENEIDTPYSGIKINNLLTTYVQEASMKKVANRIKDEDLFIGIDLHKHRWHRW